MRGWRNRQTRTFEGRVVAYLASSSLVPRTSSNKAEGRLWFYRNLPEIAYGLFMNLAGWCKGSTSDSDSLCTGSNPVPAAKRA